MSLQLPGIIPLPFSGNLNNLTVFQLPGNFLKLSRGNTMESLYQISNQNIWFLIWILKKVRFWPDLTREALEEPFIVLKRIYCSNGQIYNIHITKNNKMHGTVRTWHVNGQLRLEEHWKDGEKDGIRCDWYENGQLWWEDHWKDGKLDGIQRTWYRNGQLISETHWKDGINISW